MWPWWESFGSSQAWWLLASFEQLVRDPQRWSLCVFTEKPLPEAYPPPPAVREAVGQLGDQLRVCNAAVDFITAVPGTQVDWGVDQDTWLRTLSVERAKFAGVVRILDPITHTVVRPLKVLAADEAKLASALDEVRRAARARSRSSFVDPIPLIHSAYGAHLVGALVDYGDFDGLSRTLLREPDAEVYRRLAP